MLGVLAAPVQSWHYGHFVPTPQEISVKRLTLKSEHLSELTSDDLANVVGGSYSNLGCWLSLETCLTIAACSLLCDPIG
jgi:hypothetical protein